MPTNGSAHINASEWADEPPIDVQRVIVDPHHHLWDFGAKPFLLQEMLGVIIDAGHRVLRTVYVECHSMYRQDGPIEMRPIGETEFANGMAAMSASGRYGSCRIAAGIVGSAELRLGERVVPILEAQIAAGNGRFRGVRMPTAYAEMDLFGGPPDSTVRGVMLDSSFRAGVHALGRFGLTLDLWCLQPQLQELANLASACPETTIILDHLGTPLLSDSEPQRNPEIISSWRRAIVELARRPNVSVKLGGLGMNLHAPINTPRGAARSSELAPLWRTFIETCIGAFGPGRCMFESNFPADTACSYGALWNTFKLITAGYSKDEKTLLFSGTAEKVYRLN